MSALNEFLRSERGALARYRRRQRSRIDISVDDLEPQSKKMPDAERDKFQAAIAAQMASVGRGPFSGPIALQLDFATSSKDAPQGHTIAKNVLDLLGQRRSGLNWRWRRLLYKDDAQVQALSVSCRHGEAQPAIRLNAKPFAMFLEDLELAATTIRNEELNNPYDAQDADLDVEWIETLRQLKSNEAAERHQLGDKLYDAYYKMARWSAQRTLFGRGGTNISVLAWLYGLPKGIQSGFPKEEWARLVGGSRLRLQIGELPIATGESQALRQRIKAEIAAFKQRWDWIIDPLVVAVGLEVVIRPNPETPPASVHDLDNVVRKYLIPDIVPSFGAVSDHRWTIDAEDFRRTGSDFAARGNPIPTPPPGTRSGVTRYEAWRLPPVAGEPGFVSVALVADMHADGGLMERVDKCNRDWAEERPPATAQAWR